MKTIILIFSLLFMTAYNNANAETLTVTRLGTGSGYIDGSGWTCSNIRCTFQYQRGKTAFLMAVPQQGSTFKGWSGDCRGSGNCIQQMNTNKSLVATFDKAPINPNKATVSLSVINSNGGYVVGYPGGKSCSSNCPYTFDIPTQVEFDAIPKPGYYFSGWSGKCTGSAPACKFTIFGNTSLRATFVKR